MKNKLLEKLAEFSMVLEEKLASANKEVKKLAKLKEEASKNRSSRGFYHDSYLVLNDGMLTEKRFVHQYQEVLDELYSRFPEVKTGAKN